MLSFLNGAHGRKENTQHSALPETLRRAGNKTTLRCILIEYVRRDSGLKPGHISFDPTPP